jgi:ABC-type uncharacterized transport system auxiliary subunit
MKMRTHLPALAAVTMLLAACSGVMDSKQPARQYYMLTPYSGVAEAGSPAQGPELSINVSAVPGLDTDRVLALRNDARLNQYANARWPDHLPEVLTSVMKRSLMATGRFSAVEESTRASGDGWLLALEVQQFYGIRNAAGDTSAVRVEMAGSIECNGIHGTFTLSDSNQVADQRLSAVVASHQQGLDDVTRQLLEQISKTCR